MELGRKLRAGGASADDRDMQLTRLHRIVLRVRADAGVDYAAIETHCLLRRLQWHGVLRDTRRVEVVRDTADRDDQRIVTERPRRRDLPSFLVLRGGDPHLLLFTIEPDHLAKAITEVMPVCLREVIELVPARIHAARRNGMQ